MQIRLPLAQFSNSQNAAQLIREAPLIIWDEAPRAYRYTLEAVEHSPCDNCNRNWPFGGKMVIFGGNFKQVLPVVTRGSRACSVSSLIPRASVWSYCNAQHLRINMWFMHSNLTHNEHDWLRSFAEWILNVAKGSIQGYSLWGAYKLDWIEIPEEFLINNDSNSLKSLLEFVHPYLVDWYKDIHIFKIVVFWHP